MDNKHIETVRELIKRRQAFFEVSPYHILHEQRIPRQPNTARRIHAGFDISVYGIVEGFYDPAQVDDSALGYAALRDIAASATALAEGACTAELLRLDSTIVIDTKRHFQPEAKLGIRVTHSRGLHQPVGAVEEQMVKAIVNQLQALGVAAKK